MIDRNPSDYILAGMLNAIYSISPNKSRHSLTSVSMKNAFNKAYNMVLDDNIISYLLRKMESTGVLNVTIDPYADTLIEVSDEEIADFMMSTSNEVLNRAWLNDEWLKSALKNNRLWDDFGELIVADQNVAPARIPAADGFVTINHNAAEYVEVEGAVGLADDALRGDNEFEDNEQKTWIRVHISTGMNLLKRGLPVLKSALIALIVDPLKMAIKSTSNENTKKLVSLALTAFLKWLGWS